MKTAERGGISGGMVRTLGFGSRMWRWDLVSTPFHTTVEHHSYGSIARGSLDAYPFDMDLV